jgi:hypothetical protein
LSPTISRLGGRNRNPGFECWTGGTPDAILDHISVRIVPEPVAVSLLFIRNLFVRIPSFVALASLSALLVVPTTSFSQQLRQVQPRNSQNSQPLKQAQIQQSQGNPGAMPQTRSVRGKSGISQQALGQQSRTFGQQQTQQLFQQRQGNQQWRLGVWTDPPLGLLVTRVKPRTPAARDAGIEAGDRILDVNGVPVGWYQGQFYSLSDVLDFAANNPLPNEQIGVVNILVWDHRTGRVRNPNGEWVDLNNYPWGP